MSDLLDEAWEAVCRLPPATQDEIARTILQLADDPREPEQIDRDHLAGIRDALAQAERGEFASADEVEAAFRRFDP